jgi:hypothetical protein
MVQREPEPRVTAAKPVNGHSGEGAELAEKPPRKLALCLEFSGRQDYTVQQADWLPKLAETYLGDVKAATLSHQSPGQGSDPV